MIDLKRLRKEKGITQKELAQLLSCGQSFIANVENGRRDLQPVKIEILERKFGNICSYITNDIEEIKPIENKPKTEFVEKVAKITKKSVKTVRCWIAGTQKPDALAQSVLEKEFKVPAKYLFPEAS